MKLVSKLRQEVGSKNHRIFYDGIERSKWVKSMLGEAEHCWNKFELDWLSSKIGLVKLVSKLKTGSGL